MLRRHPVGSARVGAGLVPTDAELSAVALLPGSVDQGAAR